MNRVSGEAGPVAGRPLPSSPPHISGALDHDYLQAALARAGRTGHPSVDIEWLPLTGGRTGATVTAARPRSGPGYVHKAVSATRGFADALQTGGEAAFWLEGTSRDLPAPLDNPTLDVAYHEARDEWWLLMDDVAHGIIDRSDWTEQHTARLFDALAQLHAHHWDCPKLGATDLGTLERTTAVFAEPAAHVATGEPPSSPWVARVAEEFPVARMLLPAFLDALDGRDAMFYIDLCRQWRRIVAALEAHPATLLHGDTRRANVAFLASRVSLFDWEFAARGPAAVDLTWHWFLQYWAYPPDDGRTITERLWLREAYLDRLEQHLGRRIDHEAFRHAWDLGWLRVFVQLGYCLIDPLTSTDASSETIRQTTRRCREAMAEARRIADAHVH